jgi:hypothetical protein
MAAFKQQVSGVGKGSSRTDQNLVERTQRVQREANMANATGGPRGSAKTNREISQGGAMATTASAVSADAMTRSALNVVSPFAPGSPNRPDTDGMGGNTAGKTPNDLMANYNSTDAGSILVRAMYAAYPTPELRRYVEAYNEEGIF